MTDQASPPQEKARSLSAPDQANLFRGKFLDKCARVERWAADLLEEAGKDIQDIQYVRQRIAAVRNLAKAESSPLKSPQSVLKLLERYEPFADLRTCLAHGALEIFEARDGTRGWAFEPHCSPAAGWKATLLREAQSKQLLDELSRVANELLQQTLKPKPKAS
jgi:hypothetical protein